MLNRQFTLASCLVAFAALSAPAQAQNAPGIDPEDAVAPISIVEGAGVKVGEGTVLHPQAGTEVGYVSNVFYTHDNQVSAGLIRFLAEVGTGSLSAQRLAATEADQVPEGQQPDIGAFQYRADARIAYDYYPSDIQAVSDQGGWSGGFMFRGVINPHKPWQGAVVEDFQRLIRPVNFESGANADRDINSLKLQTQWAPTGRTLSGVLYYQMLLDHFESGRQQFADRFQNTFGLRVNWQWLPQTRIYVDASIGAFSGFGSSTKVTSYPLTTIAGIQTLITPLTTFVARAGYANGFYAAGPSYSSAVFGAQLGYRYTPDGHVAILFDYLHNDSINANFYRDYALHLTLEHGFMPFDAFVQGGVIWREYSGVINFTPPIMYGNGTRDDFLAEVVAEVRYNFRDWLAASASYHFLYDATDYTYMIGPDTINPGFIRHELLAGLRAAY